eukprot:COSAG04_NODE_11455_length_708_cov_0.891626_2_plen_72_part_01
MAFESNQTTCWPSANCAAPVALEVLKSGRGSVLHVVQGCHDRSVFAVDLQHTAQQRRYLSATLAALRCSALA